jgi:hypothetical protein
MAVLDHLLATTVVFQSGVSLDPGLNLRVDRLAQ